MSDIFVKEIFENLYSDLLKTIRTATGTDDDSNFLLWNDLTESELERLSEDWFFRSFSKPATTIVRYWNDNDSSNLLSKVAQTISLRYAKNWIAIYKAYFETEYKPLENYSMTEIRTPDLTEEIDADAKTDVHSESGSGAFGFNSDDSVPVADSYTDSNSEKEKNATHSTRTNTGTESLERSGNIGVTTSQQMLESELKLRLYDYWEMVFENIDKVICLGIF